MHNNSSHHSNRYDLQKLCLEGPQEKLNQTIYCQPAVFVASLASLERLKHEHPDAIETCVATAGFSLGELTALTFAGVLPFDKGSFNPRECIFTSVLSCQCYYPALKLVQTRAELMHQACIENPSGMATVLYGHDASLDQACREAKEWCIDRGIKNPECAVANYLFPDCKVIAGSNEALEFIQAHKKKYKLKSIKKLPVSGAFHTNLMASAVEPFADALKNIFIEEPKIHVYGNIYGTPYRGIPNILKWLPQQVSRR